MINQTRCALTFPMNTDISMIKWGAEIHLYIYSNVFYYKLARPSTCKSMQLDIETNSVLFTYEYANNMHVFINQLIIIFFTS